MPPAELATIVHDPSAHRTPTPAQLEAWDASRRHDIAQHQLARLERQRRKDEDNRTTTAAPAAAAAPPLDGVVQVQQQDPSSTAATIQQKRAEREAARRRRRKLLLLAATDADGDADAEADGGADADAEADADAAAEAIGGGGGGPVPSSSTVYTVSVPTTSDAFAWYNYENENDGDDHDDPASSPGPGPGARWRNSPHTYETLDAARAAGVWSYPANADERARCEVFRDLWEKGYYMGGGTKFGGDWLVYPGACFSAPSFSHFLFTHVCCVRACVRAGNNRRSVALSLALCCHRTILSVGPVTPDGNRGARSARHGD